MKKYLFIIVIAFACSKKDPAPAKGSSKKDYVGAYQVQTNDVTVNFNITFDGSKLGIFNGVLCNGMSACNSGGNSVNTTLTEATKGISQITIIDPASGGANIALTTIDFNSSGDLIASNLAETHGSTNYNASNVKLTKIGGQ